MAYPFPEITLNNRPVRLDDILNQHATPQSAFEETTFDFIRQWISGAESFTLHTSGSTGTPKQITVTRNQLRQSALRTINVLGLTPRQTVLVCLDTKYIAGKMMLVRAFEGNLKIVATEPAANPFQSLSPTTAIDFAAFVPLQLQELLRDSKNFAQLNTLHQIIVGGAPVNSWLEQDLQKLNCRVYGTYGMTETVSHIALQLLNGPEKADCFQVLAGIAIEQDERGCLIIQLPEFPEKIVTNDLIELLDAHRFRWQGRWDSVINSGGYKISPEKVEAEVDRVLAASSLHGAHFVGGIPDEKLGQKLILVLEGKPLTVEQENHIIDKLREILHPFEVPKQIRYSNRIIRTDTGKINRMQSLKSFY
jgi:o-succinylbenzoate---CoA ligase